MRYTCIKYQIANEQSKGRTDEVHTLTHLYCLKLNTGSNITILLQNVSQSSETAALCYFMKPFENAQVNILNNMFCVPKSVSYSIMKDQSFW